jgi:enoyl-CoA hydratase/carnithine racemase
MQDGGSTTGTMKDSTSLMSEVRHDAIAVLTFTRSEARNSLSLEMLEALQSAIDRLSGERKVSAIVLAATGPAFCAGHDLKELTSHRSDTDGGRSFYALTMSRCAAVMTSIMRSPKPFIAAVEGVATAAGCQLVATCDLAVAGAAAKFATPGVDIGLFCSTPMVALTRNVPRKRAMEMLLTGEMLGAEQAAAYGLVNRVVAEGDALDAATALGRIIASKSPATIRIGKEAFYAQVEKPVADAYAYASDVMVRNMMHRDAEEGIGAFVEKRPPAWKGD